MSVALKSLKMGHEGAPKVVIVHGLMGSLRNWLLVGKALADFFEVHLLDLRNHGESPWADSMDWPEMSADLMDYLDSEGIEAPIYLIGHSLGGKVAMHFASEYGDKVAKLVVLDIVAKPYTPHYKSEFKAMLDLDLANMQSRQSVSEALEESIPETNFRESLLTNLTRHDCGFAWKPNLKVLYACLETIRTNPLSQERVYEGETLLVKGGASDFVAEEDIERMRQYFPKLAFFLMEGVSHNPHVDGREELIKKLVEWLWFLRTLIYNTT